MSASQQVPTLFELAARQAGSKTFSFPNGDTFSVPYAVLVRAKFLDFNPNGREQFALDPPVQIPTGMEIRNIALNMFRKPERPEDYRLFDNDRLSSVLTAIQGNTPLPPITCVVQPGVGRKVVNGFHRYLASIIAGFPKIPTLTEIETAPTKPTVTPWRPTKRVRSK